MYPADLKYTKDHEWIRVTGEEGQVGITDYAQKSLGDVVFIDLPTVGKRLTKGSVFGTIESVKAVSELYAPAAGDVIAINDELTAHPEIVNAKPHETWMITVKLSNPEELDSLLDHAAYAALVDAH